MDQELQGQGIREGMLRANQRDAPKLVDGYKYDEKMILTRRIAHYLDWLAKAHPGATPSYPLIVKAVMGYDPSKRVSKEEVEHCRKRMSRVGIILESDYKRRLIPEPGFGARASHSDADLAEYGLARDTRRMVGVRNRVERTLEMITPSRIQSERLRSFVREASGAVRALAEDRITKLLLPPAGKPKS